MRKCSENKMLNGDNRFRSELDEILNWCRVHGRKPDKNTVFETRLTSIEHAMYIRHKKNLDVPYDIMEKISYIKSLPTMKQKQQADKLLYERSQYQKIEKIFPMVKLLRVTHGDDFYQSFINAEFNPFGVKIIADYVDLIVHNTSGVNIYAKLNIELLCKSVGIGITDDDIAKIQEYYCKNNIQDRRTPTKEGLNNSELAILYGNTTDRVSARKNQIQKTLCTDLDKLEDMVSLYVSGRMNEFQQLVPQNMRHMYKLQCKYNIVNIPTMDLLVLGKLFINTGSVPVSKDAPDKQVPKIYIKPDNTKDNYEKIKRLFPKVELLRHVLSPKQFDDFIKQPINNCVLQRMSDCIENRIQELACSDTMSKRNVDMFLKSYGCNITDEDIANIQTLYSLKGVVNRPNPSKNALNYYELSCLYGISENTVKACINKIKNRICRWVHFSLREAAIMYINNYIDSLIHYLSANPYDMHTFQVKHNMKKMPTDELLAAGRILYENSIYCYNVKHR